MNRLLAMALLGVGTLLGAIPAGATTTLRCESTDSRWRACSADTRGDRRRRDREPARP